MNARTPNFDPADTTELGTFDIARWKPCTPEQFLVLFAEQAFTVEGDEPIGTQATDLPQDRIRMVVYANMRSLIDDKVAVQPHLIVLYNPETRKVEVSMMRSDAVLHKIMQD